MKAAAKSSNTVRSVPITLRTVPDSMLNRANLRLTVPVRVTSNAERRASAAEQHRSLLLLMNFQLIAAPGEVGRHAD